MKGPLRATGASLRRELDRLRSASPGRLLLFVATTALLPSLLLFAVGRHFEIHRPLLNLDYLLVALVGGVTGPVLSAVALPVMMLLDLSLSTAIAYRFALSDLPEAVSYIPAFHDAPSLLLAAGAAAAVGGITHLAARTSRTLRSRLATTGFVVFCGGALLAVDGAISGSSLVNRTARDIVSPRLHLASSTFVRSSVYAELKRREREQNASYFEDGRFVGPEVPAASGFIRRAARGDSLPPRIVLVIAESLGLYRDSALNALQARALDAPELRRRYRIRAGSVPFSSHTVPAEMRELCGIRYLTVEPEVSVLEELECLPSILGRRGYRTVAIHGFSPGNFQRGKWWPALGFDGLYFRPQLDLATGSRKRCGTIFSGTCDRVVAEWVGRTFLAPEAPPTFVYWLTLTGHPPYRGVDRRRRESLCADHPLLERHRKLCAMVAQHDALLRSIAEMAARAEASGTAFVVVGDHAPVTASGTLRSLLSQERVPYFLLWPRGVSGRRAGRNTGGACRGGPPSSGCPGRRRARLLLQPHRADGDGQDVAVRFGGPDLPVGHPGEGDAPPGRAAAGGVHPSGGGRHPDGGLPERRLKQKSRSPGTGHSVR